MVRPDGIHGNTYLTYWYFAYHCAFLFHVNRLDKPINTEIASTLTKLIIQQVIGIISEHPSLTNKTKLIEPITRLLSISIPVFLKFALPRGEHGRSKAKAHQYRGPYF